MKQNNSKVFHPFSGAVYIAFAIFSVVALYFSIPLGAVGLLVCIALRLMTIQREQEQKSHIKSIIADLHIDGGPDFGVSVLNSPLPTAVALATTSEILWSNAAFAEATNIIGGALHARLNEIAPDFETRWLIDGKHAMPTELRIGKRFFFVYGTMAQGGSGQMMMLHFVDCTEYVNLRDASEKERPAIAIIAIDNYEELTKNTTDSEKSNILASVDKKLFAWTKDCNAILRKYDRDKYIFIFRNEDLDRLAAKKFSVLQEVREIQNHEGVLATLSIGIGHEGETLAESYHFASLSIDMALSRGGDQAVVKNRYSFEFYGGLSEEVEKRTKVKSRVVSNALSQLIRDSSQVIVMGHKGCDMDSVGAAAGMVCAARNKGKPAYIVVNRDRSMANELIAHLELMPEYKDVFIDEERAMVLCDFNTLLIVVDVNRPGLVESEALLGSINKIAVIDHHRRAADYITNSVVNLHEPYASSASELVSELLQYLVPTTGILKGEADAMLAGIYLDTKEFSARTGVRTFEAAAYLRRVGADIAEVKQMFRSSFAQYMDRQQIIAQARDYGHGIVVAVSDNAVNRVTAAQAADELLDIIGITASIVAYHNEDSFWVSARSSGTINMQILMEQMGGGGNHAAAGAQLSHLTKAQTEQKIRDAIEQYFEKQAVTAEDKQAE